MKDLYTLKTVKDINTCKEDWLVFEYNNWKLISFNENEARFGEMNPRNGQFLKYADINKNQLKFLNQVPADAWYICNVKRDTIR